MLSVHNIHFHDGIKKPSKISYQAKGNQYATNMLQNSDIKMIKHRLSKVPNANWLPNDISFNSQISNDYKFHRQLWLTKTQQHNNSYKLDIHKWIIEILVMWTMFNPFMQSGLFYLNCFNIRNVWLFLLLPCFIEIPVINANSVDPDQMTCSAGSDLGLHCLQMSLFMGC